MSPALALTALIEQIAASSALARTEPESRVLVSLPLILALAAPAQAFDPSLPSRPLTYPVDTKLTDGAIPNLRELYVSPETFIAELKPVATPRVGMFRPAKARAVLTREEILVNDRVSFALDKADIESESLPLLDLVAEVLLGNPEALSIEVQGHTDAQGDAAYNQTLSDKRAASVRDYLVGKGIGEQRLVAKGYGESQLLTQGTDPVDHATNRRVVFQILSWDDKALAKRQEKSDLKFADREETRKEFAAEQQELRQKMVPSSGDLPLNNEQNGWAKISVNGTEVGVIGPLTNSVIRGVPWGFYDVTLTVSTGFSWTHRVLTVGTEGIIVPGGKEAQVVVDDYSKIPSWNDNPELGHMDLYEKARAREARRTAAKSKP